MINIIICDDDSSYTKETYNLISNYLSTSPFGDVPVNIECSTSSTETFLRAKQFQPDILILDIHMPEKDGFEVASEFHKNNPSTKIIFLTNYEQFVFYSLRFSPFRFVRKSKIENELPEAIYSAILSLTSTTKTLTIRRYSDYDVIPINNIIYIEKIKYKNFLNIVCTNGNIEYRETVQVLEKKLEGSSFFRINSGTIINFKYIKQISGQDIILSNGKILSVSNSKINSLKKGFVTYQRFDY